jgi:hypothetical protein
MDDNAEEGFTLIQAAAAKAAGTQATSWANIAVEVLFIHFCDDRYFLSTPSPR